MAPSQSEAVGEQDGKENDQGNEVKSTPISITVSNIRLHLDEEETSPEESREQEDKKSSIPEEQESDETLEEESKSGFRNPSRKRVPWSIEELNELICGVEQNGLGCWKKILQEGKNVFDSQRRPIDLVDKYRQYTKSTSFYTTNKRSWVELLEQDQARVDASGEIVVFKEKFPYDAAMRFARRRLPEKTSEFQLRIQDVDCPTGTHTYLATVKGGRVKLRKLYVPKELE